MNPFKMLIVFSAVLVLFGSTAFAEGKVDPLLRIMADNPEAAMSGMKAFGAKSSDSGVAMADVLVKAEEGQAEAAIVFIEELGGSVRTVVGDIMTASIPLDSIEDLDASPLIAAVEAAKPMKARMNWARSSVADGGSAAAEVQAGTCTGCAPSPGAGGYTGTDVIVGVVDSGIDCQNADFKNSAGTTRIVAYWDQTIAGTGVAEIAGSTGKEYTGTALTDGSCAVSADTEGHGTHVTGIAAGSNATYKGVAPTASIVSVKYSNSSSTSVVDGSNYIFKKADALNKAAVVNLSLGTALGAHDGTSLMEQGLDALLVSGSTDKKGRAIVAAAGNENFMTSDPDAAIYGGIHATIDNANGVMRGYEFNVRSDAASTAAIAADGLMVDFWLDSGADCTVKVEGYKGGAKVAGLTMDWVAYGAATTTKTDDAVTISLSYSETAASGKKHGTALITRAGTGIVDTILNGYTFYFALNGTCTGNAWLYPDYTAREDFTKVQQTAPDGYTYVAGDSIRTVGLPGTASKIITAASYMDRPSWVSMDGTTYFQTTYGACDGSGSGGTSLNISLFSSLGPTANASDLQKPDIAAPGEPIVATLSSGISSVPAVCSKGDATHYKLEGTSMATPHVVGVVALMFQKNNCLTYGNAKTYLRSSATTDAFTGSSIPNYTWGYGKLNAAAVMNQFSADASCYTTPTPSSGGSGCSLSGAEDGEATSAAGIVALLALSCFMLGVRRQWSEDLRRH